MLFRTLIVLSPPPNPPCSSCFCVIYAWRGEKKDTVIPTDPSVVFLVFVVLFRYYRGVKKENLPSKICVVCNRPFTWRKKWERVSLNSLSLSLSPSIFLIQLTDEWIITSLSLSLSPSLSHPSFVLLSSVGMKCFAVLRDVRTREREIRGQPTRRLAPSRVLAPLVPLVEAIPEFCQ